MTTPPPRKRFQIHLSTAIVMMFVAGTLIWANATGRDYYLCPLGLDGQGRKEYDFTFGWPKNAAKVTWYYYGDASYAKFRKAEYSGTDIAINIAIAVSILFATWFLCEWLIRRRAARKGA